MAKLTPRLIIALLTFLIGVVATTVWYLKRPPVNEKVRLVIPNHPWEPSFFNSLNEHMRNANLPSLRTLTLPDDDVEVRVWYDTLPDGIDGVILHRSNNQWSAVHLQGRHPKFQMQQRVLAAPKSGWDVIWGKLLKAGILKLPDASEAGCHSGVLDGIGYIVETNADNIYRVYRYGNPEFMKCNEAQRVLEIRDVLEEEFNFWDAPNRE